MRITPDAVVRYGYLDEDKRFPLVIEPAVDGVNLAGWAAANREQLEARLLQHGAILEVYDSSRHEYTSQYISRS